MADVEVIFFVRDSNLCRQTSEAKWSAVASNYHLPFRIHRIHTNTTIVKKKVHYDLFLYVNNDTVVQ